MKAKCQKALNLLRVVAHTDWGADRKVLLHLYRTIVRSKLDYGSVVYGSARESYLKTLDTIHHQGIRLALGAFRTSPADSLLVEANEPSLNDRREKLSLQFALKLNLIALIQLIILFLGRTISLFFKINPMLSQHSVSELLLP